ncbi:hypothetical protein K1719_021224 [Acacia pycnantha]|nr:hypothetical protein K1719_021224 [Acacia pycnantha]
MSHREGRDSARRSSRFDREPSPKSFRRDGLQERERSRVTSTADLDNVDHNGKDHKHQRRLHDVVPVEASLTHDSKKETEAEKRIQTRNQMNILKEELFLVQGGGNAADALTCVAHFVLKPRLISKVADDAQGKGILDELFLSLH